MIALRINLVLCQLNQVLGAGIDTHLAALAQILINRNLCHCNASLLPFFVCAAVRAAHFKFIEIPSGILTYYSCQLTFT